MLAGVILLVCHTNVVHAELSWIWSTPAAKSGEKADFRKEFTVPGEAREAILEVSCDNGAKVVLNGKPAGECKDWKRPIRADVKALIKKGQNELTVEGRNEDGVAALVLRLKVTAADGTTVLVETDSTWTASAAGQNAFKPVHVMGKYPMAPWQKVLDGQPAARTAGPAAAEAPTISALPGFQVDLLYTVPKEQQGSWISMTVDPKGRLIVCDQKGGLYRVTLPEKDGKTVQKVEPLKTSLGGAHGLIYAFNSLYVMVNEKQGRGIWRLRDNDGDDQFEEENPLRSIEGSGEHGPHGLKLSPDGKSLYFVCGNFTKLPEEMEQSRAARAWGEDHVIERMWDANGHARNIVAPGGFICKTDPDGTTFELVSYGYRNTYGIAFNALGDLFAYDSDMEWDAGTPWYRPTRICMSPSGSDLGWRSGAGNWPTYYPDALPAILDIGPGSPTGMVSGQGAKFPAKYQQAVYACDWTYGTMYAIHLEPEGASYRATKEEFVSGRPLPLTDLVIHPDGAMYFAIGGRNTQSALYRVSYVGKESTAPTAAPALTTEHRLRRELECLHDHGTGPEAVDKAWPALKHPDRFVRYAARVAIERQPAAGWADRAIAETNDQAALEACLALSRLGDKSLQSRILKRLHAIPYASLNTAQRLALLRNYQVCITRMGMPAGADRNALLARLEPLYPAPDNAQNRELSQLLIALDSPRAVAKTVQLLATARDEDNEADDSELLSRNSGYASAFSKAKESRPNRQQIALAYALRVAKTGWTPELHTAFFEWFPRTGAWQGGNSFRKFIENIRTETLAKVTDAGFKTKLETISARKADPAMAAYQAPKGPGQNYTVAAAEALAKGGLKGRNYENGKAMFASTLCATCHRFNGDGGGLGPDLTGAGARYTLHDLLENIIEPSKVISDQYESTQIEKADGSVVIGRVMVEENGKLFVAMNPFAPGDTVAIDEKQVTGRKPYTISMMPPGLINSLNPNELLDLLAYIQSAGNPKDKAFAP